MQLFKIRILFVLLPFIFLACNGKQKSEQTQALTQKQVTEKLLEANTAAIDVENQQIDVLIANSGWDMVKTGTGLRYQVLEKSTGEKAVAGKVAVFEYEVKLISGEVIYSSAISGIKEFKIGSGGVESGLEEGILLLHAGEKARFVIPSYLAHGLSGDQNKIPPKATLIYTLQLIKIK